MRAWTRSRGSVTRSSRRIRSVTHLQEPRPQLALVSELPAGERLSTILRAVEQTGQHPAPGAVVWLLREMLPALSSLHASGARIASGLITPERIFVGPDGRLILAEYALGDALTALSWTPAKLWGSLAIPLRPASDRAVIDEGSDVSQLALVALALLNGQAAGRQTNFQCRGRRSNGRVTSRGRRARCEGG